jgi:hypothetical protein
MAKQIVITVGLDGQATVEADGFSGPACAKATAEVLRALGGEQEETRKPEWRAEARLEQQAGN